jgi:hypothetical protein
MNPLLNRVPMKTALNLCISCIAMRRQDHTAALLLPKRAKRAQTVPRRSLLRDADAAIAVAELMTAGQGNLSPECLQEIVR